MQPYNTCPNCGVRISDLPDDDLHPVQASTYVADNGYYCEACAFQAPLYGEYNHDGATVVRAATVTMPDDELAEAFASSMRAQELRQWMSNHDITRSRGARKYESALQAVEQDRTAVAAFIASRLNSKPHHVTCTTCEFEEAYASTESAINAARSHKSNHPRHFPRAYAHNEERIYG